MKRTTVFTIAFMLVGLLATAQKDFKKSLSGISRVEIETGTSVKIIKGTGSEIVISDGCKDCGGDEDHNVEVSWEDENRGGKSEDDRARGLKAVYATGEDNTGVGMFVETDGETLRVKDLKTFWKRKGLTITLPATVALNINTGSLGSATVSGWSSELEVNTSVGNIKLDNVTGPITAHSSTGAIDVIFGSVNQDAPISISSSTGVIDVTLPTSTKASVEMKSTMGTVYTNFDLVKPREDGLKALNEKAISGDLNNGGVKISLKASTGNIYLRKK